MGPAFFKFISVRKLKELLAQVPENYMVNAQSIGQTGNLGVFSIQSDSCELISENISLPDPEDLYFQMEYILDIGAETLEGTQEEGETDLKE